MLPLMTDAPDTAELLLRSHAGDRRAFDTVFTRLYDDLGRVARGQLRRARRRETLDTTALIHDAYIRLVGERGVPWACRAHFLAIAARAMRRSIVDHVRVIQAQKRGGGRALVTLSPELLGEACEADTLLLIDQALVHMAEFSERLPQVAECRLFGGLSEAETADALGVSVRTVQRDWRRARAWLQQALGD